MGNTEQAGDVLRKSANECGFPVGQLNLVIKDSPKPFETVSFYCTLPKLHKDECMFVGTELVVKRRRRDDGEAPKVLLR